MSIVLYRSSTYVNLGTGTYRDGKGSPTLGAQHVEPRVIYTEDFRSITTLVGSGQGEIGLALVKGAARRKEIVSLRRKGRYGSDLGGGLAIIHTEAHQAKKHPMLRTLRLADALPRLAGAGPDTAG